MEGSQERGRHASQGQAAGSETTLAAETFPDPGRSAEAQGVQDPVAQLEVLRRVCHGFASATTVDEVAASLGFWIRASVGADQATFRLLVPDSGGRLRTVASNEASEGGRKRSVRRRIVFRSKRAAFLSLNGPSHATLGFFPLVSQGEPVGMLEVTAPGPAIEARKDTLLAVASQVAIALRNSRERSLVERQASPTIGFMELVRDLVTAPTARPATAIAVRLCFEQLEVPVCGWAMADNRSRLELTAVRGLDPQTRRNLRRLMGIISPPAHQSPRERRRLTGTFAEATGTSGEVTVADAGDALLFIGGRSAVHQPFVDNLVALLQDTLRNIAVTAQAERRNRHLDLGIAWTAHELRRPLLALRFLMGSVLNDRASGRTDKGIKLLQRQLDELVKGIDGMLQWATGGRPSRSRSFELVCVVQGVVDAFRVERGRGRLRLRKSPPVMVEGDPFQIQHAIENLVVNALNFSPADSKVDVGVDLDEEGVTVTLQDHGPGIPAAYRDAIFDPFVRVGTSRQPRGGQGLGLFIARQIVEGHGGALWLEPARKGATFRLRLPRVVARRQDFAS
jgi:signal transduction histidine kinase